MKRLLAAFFLLLAGPVLAAPQSRPNILLLMAEDMSSRVGAFGDPVAVTPNIDALAALGVRYPNTCLRSQSSGTHPGNTPNFYRHSAYAQHHPQRGGLLFRAPG
jgi:arylsulfatase A-like enzyme